jgi:hypothetical protein
LLSVVRPDILAACDRRIDAEILLHGTQAAVLDRSPSLDDAGDRGGSTLGRLLEGVSHERARCAKGIPLTGDNVDTAFRQSHPFLSPATGLAGIG